MKTSEAVEAALPETERPTRSAWTVPLWIIAVLVTIVFCRLARDTLVPFALSLLFALVLSGCVEFLKARHIPRAISALLLLVVLASAIGGLLDLVWSPAQEWLANVPHTMQTIERRLRPAQAFVRQFQDTAKRATSLVSAAPTTPAATAPAGAPTAPATTAATLLTETGSVMQVTATILIFTLFLLAAGPPTLARMAAATARDLHAVHVLKVIEAVRLEVGRYYATLALINLGLGALTALVMSVLGMPSPILWGVVAGILNFIPYLGSATTLLVLTTVALVTFSSTSQVLVVFLSYVALAAIEGQIVQPIFVGRRLDLNPVLVFLAVWMGGAIWGVAGIVLAVPILVATKVAASHSAGGAVVAEFLSPSPSGPLTPLRRSVARARDAATRQRKAA